MARFKKVEYIKKNAIPLAALGISTANFTTNKSRRSEAEEQNKKQIKAMNKLADSLSKVSASFDEADKRGAVIVKEKELPKKKKFRIGYYSEIAEDIFGGGMKGLGVGTLINGIALGASVASQQKNGWPVQKALKTVGYSVLVGASLGLVLGITRKIAEMSSRSKTNHRVINTVSSLLKKRGFKEDFDFTRDPKFADLEKTKVTLVVNRGNGDLKLALNLNSDDKLEKVCVKALESLPPKAKTFKKESNRYNEIMITTLSSGNDAILISDITEKFIRAGYPVYLIEVG